MFAGIDQIRATAAAQGGGGRRRRARAVRRRGGEIEKIVLRGEERLQRIESDIVEIHQIDRLNQIGVVLDECVGIVLYKGLLSGLNDGVEIGIDVRLMSVNRLSSVVLLIGRTMIIHVLMANLIARVDRVRRGCDVRIVNGDVRGVRRFPLRGIDQISF